MHQLTKGSFTNLNMSEMPSEVKKVSTYSNTYVEQILAIKFITYGGITYSSGLCVTLRDIYCLLAILKKLL